MIFTSFAVSIVERAGLARTVPDAQGRLIGSIGPARSKTSWQHVLLAGTSRMHVLQDDIARAYLLTRLITFHITIHLTTAVVVLFAELGLAQTDWIKHPANPVLGVGPSSWDLPNVINPSVR